jgi:hypothetical protein
MIKHGTSELGEGKGDHGADMFDLFLPPDNRTFDLPGFVDQRALLFLMTQENGNKLNFITFNADPAVSGQSYEDAKYEDYFVDRIIENDSRIWNLQIARVPVGVLHAEGNRLGIHSRNADGEAAGNRDDFSVARIVLFYVASE